MVDIAQSKVGVTTWLVLSGPLVDKAEVLELQDVVHACRSASELYIVLDLAGVSLLSSLALEVLLEEQEELVRLGGRLQITNANSVVRDVLVLTESAQSITILDSNGEQVPVLANRAPTGPRRKLGELLIEQGLLSAETVAEAMQAQSATGRRLGHILVDKGWVKESDLLNVLSAQLRLPFVRLRAGLFDVQVVRLISADIAKRFKVVPLFKVHDTIYLATADPQAVPSFDAVEELTGCRTKPVLATSQDIITTINDSHGDDYDLAQYISELDAADELELIDQSVPDKYTVIDEVASGSPIINLINGLIQRAVRDGASDIHIEPSRKGCRIRFRIDGVLYQAMNLPLDTHPALISRLKVMASLDIAERRLPQDGRIQVYTSGRTIDLRFSSLPGILGEKVVLRVLDRRVSLLDIEKLGMSPSNLDSFKTLLGRSFGLVLVTGPTGSGKTTTLYAALDYLNSVDKSIVTIEDPVEYQLDVINQNQVREEVGLNFARVLRHVLRQDPDIVMVGEIRDRETAEIAVQAALTGHLVLSTLHTNDSVGAITRLLDMGVEPFLLSSALIGVIAQRLVRTVCPECRTSYVAPPGSLTRYGVEAHPQIRLVRGRGCRACYDSGYKGRLAIYEILPCDSTTQRLMIATPSREALAAHLTERGIATLFNAGLQQALSGRTTIEEITRTVDS